MIRASREKSRSIRRLGYPRRSRHQNRHIGKDKTEITFPIDLNAKTPLGEYIVLFTAKTKHQGKEYAGIAPPLLLTLGLPFDLRVEPYRGRLETGGENETQNHGGTERRLQGPDHAGIPQTSRQRDRRQGVDRRGSDYDRGRSRCRADAMPLTQTDVEVAGTATALNNLQNSSPPFTVRSGKEVTEFPFAACGFAPAGKRQAPGTSLGTKPQAANGNAATRSRVEMI